MKENKYNPQHFMQIAINLAKRNIGQTQDNPSVGCLVVKDGVIISQAVTAVNGRPHAEAIALENAYKHYGQNSYKSDIYVTLEPCNNHGQTPPCVDNIIKCKAKNIYIACQDKHKKTNGASIAKLKQNNINVVYGLLQKEAEYLYKGFFNKVVNNLPNVTVKLATSKDNKILKGDGKVNWLTNTISRNIVHKIRSQTDCLVTSINTIIDDNPKLNVRLNGLETTKPDVVVVGSEIKRELFDNFVKSNNLDWQYSSIVDIKQLLTSLSVKGYSNIMLEAGPALSKAFIESGFVDKIYHFKTNTHATKQGIDLGFSIDKIPKFEHKKSTKLDNNILNLYEK